MSEEQAANLWDEVSAICGKLGYEPSRVRRIDLRLKEAALEVYRLNDEGKKFIDLESDEAVVDTITLPITTRVEDVYVGPASDEDFWRNAKVGDQV